MVGRERIGVVDGTDPRAGGAPGLARGTALCGTGGAIMSAPVLETIGLEKKFGGLTATSNVSLKVEKGARHALIGPNGAGKTTLINLLTGVLRPTAGRILLDERDITALAPHRRVKLGIARTFQINQLFGDLTPLETISLAVSERIGAGKNWWRLVGGRRELMDEVARDPGELPPHRRDGRAHGDPALRQAAAARDRGGGGQPAARAAAGRAGGRRARGRAAHDPGHRRGPAGRCLGAADRA